MWKIHQFLSSIKKDAHKRKYWFLFPMLKCSCIFFQIKYIRMQFRQTLLGNCCGLKLPECWLPFKNKLTVPFVIIFVSTLSFRVGIVQDHDDRPQPPVRTAVSSVARVSGWTRSISILHDSQPGPETWKRPGPWNRIGVVAHRTAVYSAGPSPWFRPFTYLHTHQSSGPLSGTTRASRYQKGERSSAIIAEGPRDASRQLKSCQLPRNSAGTTCTTSPEQIESRKPAQSTTQTPKQKTHTPV